MNAPKSLGLSFSATKMSFVRYLFPVVNSCTAVKACATQSLFAPWSCTLKDARLAAIKSTHSGGFSVSLLERRGGDPSLSNVRSLSFLRLGLLLLLRGSLLW